jgi:large subunit ribosomal protein L31e
MADKKTETNKLEREYVIPLRNKWKRVPRYKRANKAIKAIKEFLVRHMKIRDRDLKKIKIDKYLNEEVWFKGIKKPPARIKVKASKDEKGEVKVELSEMHEKLKFKKAREEKREQKATEMAEGKVKEAEKEKTDAEKPVDKKEEETKKEEAKEKKSAVVEAGQKMAKESAKKTKHEVGGKTKEPKHQIRKALNK